MASTSDMRRALKGLLTGKVSNLLEQFHYCDRHDCKTHGNWATGMGESEGAWASWGDNVKSYSELAGHDISPTGKVGYGIPGVSGPKGVVHVGGEYWVTRDKIGKKYLKEIAGKVFKDSKRIDDLKDEHFIQGEGENAGKVLHPNNHLLYRLREIGLQCMVTDDVTGKGKLYDLINTGTPVGIKDLTSGYKEFIYKTDIKDMYLIAFINPRSNKIETVYPSNLSVPAETKEMSPTALSRPKAKDMIVENGGIKFTSETTPAENEALKKYIETDFSFASKYNKEESGRREIEGSHHGN